MPKTAKELKKMAERDAVLAQLKELAKGGDQEINHSTADAFLLALINDPEITEAYNKIKKWYA